ncbi:MAG: aminopeptidase N, partial [Pseudomonadota bacterium]|nr:aminopeptidase N [Pseudomonadota bacterium]
MSAAAPEAIRLADYRPPAYLIEGIDLTFALTDGAATVTAEVTGRRNPAAAVEDRDLVLNGRGLEILSLTLDGCALTADQWRHDGEELRLGAVGERFAYTVVTRFDPAANSALEGL